MLDKTKRPVIDIPLSNTDYFIEALAAFGLVLNVGVLFLFWSQLPDKVPVHFNMTGQADSWGSKSTLLILPIVSSLLYVMLTVLNRYPQIFNYPVEITEENAGSQYRIGQSIIRWLKTEVMLLFAYINWGTIQTGLGNATGLSVWFVPLILIVVFGTIAYFLVKAYRTR